MSNESQPPQTERKGVSYSSYKALKKRLGSMGALIELDQLAMAEFRLAAEDSGDIRRHVENRSKVHRIHVQSSAIADMISKMSQLHIVLMHEALEWFLKAFRRESASNTGVAWSKRKDGEDRVTHVLRDLAEKFADSHHPDKACVPLIQFFRLARNCAVHPLDESHENYLEEAMSNIQIASEGILKRYGRLPNGIEKFELADVVLFSRAIQDFAMTVCLAVRPDDEAMWKSIDLKRFKRVKHEEKRYRNAIIGDLRTRFHLDPQEAALILDRWAD